jgi:ribosomal protein S27E
MMKNYVLNFTNILSKSSTSVRCASEGNGTLINNSGGLTILEEGRVFLEN